MRCCPHRCSARAHGGILKKNRILTTCIYEAAAIVAARIRIEEYKMRYPHAELFSNIQQTVQSELFWNPEYGKRALVEILSSLEGMEAFLNGAGQPASFACIVAHFEQLLHVQLPRPYQIRTQVLERKIKRTDFIDRMKDTLIKMGDIK
ncbi:RteC domain-containing protein [uncultured Alistipes sp.]|uniref:RteC domain-containing protein n=1 Tax=uncultured Alistipes sp. TaxID=538949 RepID=UPI00341BF201